MNGAIDTIPAYNTWRCAYYERDAAMFNKRTIVPYQLDKFYSVQDSTILASLYKQI